MSDTRQKRAASQRLFDIESPLAIELRRIMIRLGRTLDLERKRCVMITSAQRGEGKSLFASHFALVLAQHLVKRVLLVDGDLRRPVQHAVYQVPRVPGFAELLTGGALQAARTPLPNFDVLAAGNGVQDASLILSVPRVTAAIEACKAEYDLVILDSPPVVPVSDPLQYVEAVDGVIYILMAGRTPQDVVIRGVEILRGVGAHILGVVANNLSEVLPYYYDRKYYGYAAKKQQTREGPLSVDTKGSTRSPSVLSGRDVSAPAAEAKDLGATGNDKPAKDR